MTLTERLALVDRVITENEVTKADLTGYVASLPEWELVVFEESMRRLRELKRR